MLVELTLRHPGGLLLEFQMQTNEVEHWHCFFKDSLMPRDQPRTRYRSTKHSNMSSERTTAQDDIIYSPHHATATANNARNRARTISASSSNQDFAPDTALLDNNDENDDIIEGQGYRERVVILTEHEDREVDEDSGISEATEEHLLPDSREVEPRIESRKETMWHVGIQVFIPFLIAGFGMMAAGLLLDKVQHWDVYENINEIFILIPALLGLKGNLEMTLASRLSTAANVGQLNDWRSRWKLTWGNLVLIQGQALVVAGLATVISLILGADLQGAHQLLLGASAMGSASIASAILGSIMIGVIIGCHILHINPDNVATPVAASLGDLVTLGLLSVIAAALYNIGGSTNVAAISNTVANITNITDTETNSAYTITTSSVILTVLIVLIPVWLYMSYKNSATKNVLFYGWFPVICAMVISSGGGWVLSAGVRRFKGIAIYSPIINGVGGNLVAVQASRISTSLHQAGTPGKLPPNSPHRYQGPLRTFFRGGSHSSTAKLLVMMVIPGSALFLFAIALLQAGHTTLTLLFFIGYLICALLQVIILLLVADWMVHTVWRFGIDPDNAAIPFLTALGDLLGTGLLTLGFLIMWLLGDRDEDVGE